MKSGDVKLEHIETLIKRNVAMIFKKYLRTPALSNATVTVVKVAPDLQNATVFVVFSENENIVEKLRALNKLAGFVRYKLAQEISSLRKIPKLKFVNDKQFEIGFELINLLKK